MSNFLKLTVDFLQYVGVASTNDPKDACKITSRVEESNVNEISRQMLSVPDSTTDQVIQLPDPTIEYLLIFSDQNISIKLNSSSDALNLNVKTAGTKAPVFLQRGEITALSVSNSSGNAANIDVIAVKAS